MRGVLIYILRVIAFHHKCRAIFCVCFVRVYECIPLCLTVAVTALGSISNSSRFMCSLIARNEKATILLVFRFLLFKIHNSNIDRYREKVNESAQKNGTTFVVKRNNIQNL